MRGMTTTNEVIEQVVAAVREIEAKQEEQDRLPPQWRFYTDAFTVARVTGLSESQVKRALDKEAKKDDARLLRFSRRQGTDKVPRLDGTLRYLHGNAVTYITTESYARCEAAVAAYEADCQAKAEALDDLLSRAAKLGLPAPTQFSRGWPDNSVTFNQEAYRALVEAVESDYL